MHPWEAADAAGLGLTADDLRAWTPFRPLEIDWARRHGMSPPEARRWAAAGVSVRDAVRAAALGIGLDGLRRWEAAGFAAADACEATETGVAITEAAAWREAGFVAPDALQLIRDGWTLDAARAARDRDIRRYERRTATSRS